MAADDGQATHSAKPAQSIFDRIARAIRQSAIGHSTESHVRRKTAEIYAKLWSTSILNATAICSRVQRAR
ncbi:hypothetical protein [Burkholderia ubonensis]|uniref:hypothetical protein n=1 Tax=Burkholderia ubonensis TaxID=101571 RepID=UPI0012F9BC84|nr:hypothetical protein [Burkholderia ubonensis]